MERIEKLNKEIKNLRLKKLSLIAKNPEIGLKLCARVVVCGLVFIVPAVITGQVGKSLNAVPFSPYQKEYEVTTTEFNSNGDYSTSSNYGITHDIKNNTEKAKSTLTLYSKWQKNNDGLYARKVDTYLIGKKTYEELKDLSAKENLKIQDILGKPIESTEEFKTDIKEEELEQDAYFEATIYSVDKDNYITVKKSIGQYSAHVLVGAVLYLMFLIPSEVIGTRISLHLVDINDEYDDLNEMLINNIELRKELKKELKR